jgi:DNA-directed RNA polymerase subunit K/omega
MSDEEDQLSEEYVSEDESISESEEEAEEDHVEEYKDEDCTEFQEEENLQKFNSNTYEEYVQTNYAHERSLNYEDILALSTVKRNELGMITDINHTTLPLMTKYEYTRILGVRASQINNGAQIFVEIDDSVIDGYLIAREELKAKKIPFIIQRPLPNGKMEFWKIEDLEILI